MLSFLIKETEFELIGLEPKFPLMLNRLRWLRSLKTNPLLSIQYLVSLTNTTEFEMDRWASLYRFGGIDLLMNSQTILNIPTSQSKTFSDHAKDMLQDLFLHNEKQLGRQLWIEFEKCKKSGHPGPNCVDFGNHNDFEKQFKSWRRTDCQTYIQDVLRFAFEKTNNRKLYDGLSAFYKKNGVTGTVMAQYLVSLGWKAYFFMPDTDNPSDGDQEHTKKYKEAVKTNKWWGVPLAGFIVNYNPTLGTLNTTPSDVNGVRKLASLAKVKFAASIFTKGLHTGILSEGNILEVHWKSMSTQTAVDMQYQNFQKTDLYDKTNLLDFAWKEGIFVVPPDSAAIN